MPDYSGRHLAFHLTNLYLLRPFGIVFVLLAHINSYLLAGRGLCFLSVLPACHRQPRPAVECAGRDITIDLLPLAKAPLIAASTLFALVYRALHLPLVAEL